MGKSRYSLTFDNVTLFFYQFENTFPGLDDVYSTFQS